VTIVKAIENAVETLEALGYRSGDIHDDLVEAARSLRKEFPEVAKHDVAIVNDGNEQIDVFVDGKWHTPYKINDQRNKQGWVGYRLLDGRTGVAVAGEYRYAPAEVARA
jgi:hypothetical protein